MVRHPQHLGLAILTLGILLFNRAGPRPSDIIAWTLLVFSFMLLAESEEEGLQRKFGEEHQAYRRRVPFMIPMRMWFRRAPRILPSSGWKRRLALIGLYLLFAVALIARTQKPTHATHQIGRVSKMGYIKSKGFEEGNLPRKIDRLYWLKIIAPSWLILASRRWRKAVQVPNLQMAVCL